MINCRACSFDVAPGMRHALVNNCCPACGGALLTQLYWSRLELFKEKIRQQEFSRDLSEDNIFDMALFVLSEFFPAKGSEEASSEAPTDTDEEEPEVASEEDTFEKIREEVRTEKFVDSEEDLDDLDLDLKVARLKRIAKESPMKSRGPAVRRITGD